MMGIHTRLFAGLCLVVIVQAKSLEDRISEAISGLAQKELKITEFEEHLDETLEYEDVKIDENTVKEIANRLKTTLNRHMESMEPLKEDVEDAFKQLSPSRSADQPLCCNVSSPDYIAILKGNGNLNKMCLAGDVLSDKSKGSMQFVPSDPVLSSMKAAYKEGVKYVYFADERGVLYNYPALSFCGLYEPRLRPWYVLTATPKPKDVVIVMDKSKSMRHLMGIAKKVAITVIQTLNMADRAAVIAFGTESETPQSESSFAFSSCYSNTLAKAIDINKNRLEEFIKDILADATGTSYYNALQTAFQMFNNSPPDAYDGETKRDKVILFLSDGDYEYENETKIYQLIAEENSRLDNEVVILTFGIGNDIKHRQVLINIAEQILSTGEFLKGEFTNILSTDNLRYQLTSYYDYFQAGTTKVTFNRPYNDAFGTGPLLGICNRIQGDNLQGVFCIDMDISYLLESLNDYNIGDESYVFVIDQESRVLSHPLLPITSQLDTDFYIVYLPMLEGAQGMEEIRKSMVSGGSGSRTLSVLRPVRYGSGKGQEVFEYSYNSTYYWYPVEGTVYSVCIVTNNDGVKSSIKQPAYFPPVKYHTDVRTDKSTKTCRSFDRKAIKDHSAVMLSLSCFKDSFQNFHNNETEIQKVKPYLEDKTVDSAVSTIKQACKKEVASSYEADNLWKAGVDDSEHSLRKYFGSRHGVVRTYPGIELPTKYDPTAEQWYIGGIALTVGTNDNGYHMSSPHIDDFGAGHVITISRAVTAGHDHKFTLGVMAMDVAIETLRTIITGAANECAESICIITNKAGYVVFHSDWFKTGSDGPDFETELHLVKVDPQIAQRMIRDRAMLHSNCINIAGNFENKSFWEMSDLEDSKYYRMSAVRDTNLHVIIKKAADDSDSTCDRCRDVSCPSGKTCHCPCQTLFREEEFHYCEAVYEANSDSAPPCFPSLPRVNFTTVNDRYKGTLDSLEPCVHYKCQEISDKSGCSSYGSCQWCTSANDGKSLQADYCIPEYCAFTWQCPYGQHRDTVHSVCEQSTQMMNTSAMLTEDRDSGLPDWAIVVLVLVALAVGVGGTTAFFLLYYNPRKMKVVPDGDRYAEVKDMSPHTFHNDGYLSTGVIHNAPVQTEEASNLELDVAQSDSKEADTGERYQNTNQPMFLSHVLV